MKISFQVSDYKGRVFLVQPGTLCEVNSVGISYTGLTVQVNSLLEVFAPKNNLLLCLIFFFRNSAFPATVFEADYNRVWEYNSADGL